jgi:hypothetical protein
LDIFSLNNFDFPVCNFSVELHLLRSLSIRCVSSFLKEGRQQGHILLSDDSRLGLGLYDKSVIHILTYLLTPWYRIFFEKLTVTELVKPLPAFFMAPEGSLPCLQKPATEPYPEPAESNLSHRSLSP